MCKKIEPTDGNVRYSVQTHEMQEPGVGFDAGVPGIIVGFFLCEHDAGRPAVGSTVSASFSIPLTTFTGLHRTS